MRTALLACTAWLAISHVDASPAAQINLLGMLAKREATNGMSFSDQLRSSNLLKKRQDEDNDGDDDGDNDGDDNGDDGDNDGDDNGDDGDNDGQNEDFAAQHDDIRQRVQDDPDIAICSTYNNLFDEGIDFGIEFNEDNQNCVPGVMIQPVGEDEVNQDEIDTFCPDFATAQGQDLTDGIQKVEGSYSATIIGTVPARNTRCKILEPLQLQTLQPQDNGETISIVTECLDYAASIFIDASVDYYRDPILLENGALDGNPIGHIHMTCEFLGDLSVNQSADEEGNDFAGFQGINKDPANRLTAQFDLAQPGVDGDITEGLLRCTILPSTQGHQCLVLPEVNRVAEFDSVTVIVGQLAGAGIAFEPVNGGQIFQNLDDPNLAPNLEGVEGQGDGSDDSDNQGDQGDDSGDQGDQGDGSGDQGDNNDGSIEIGGEVTVTSIGQCVIDGQSIPCGIAGNVPLVNQGGDTVIAIDAGLEEINGFGFQDVNETAIVQDIVGLDQVAGVATGGVEASEEDIAQAQPLA